jgi:co-chaperonin GroES (HSP10)
MTPLADHIILKQDLSDAVSPGGIVFVKQDELAQGLVVAIGPNVDEVKVGERVMYSPHAGQKFKHEGADLTAIAFQDLFGVLDPS